MSGNDDDDRMLTPADMKKLPYCKRAWFGKCSKKDPSLEYCIRCQLEEIFQALGHEDIAHATHALMVVMNMLGEKGVIKHD